MPARRSTAGARAPRPEQANGGADVRPLSARSVLASTLLGVPDARLPVESLLRAGAAFEIAEGTVRVALSRMVRAGELRAEPSGRYALAGHLLARHQRQTESRAASTRRWTGGEWELVVVRDGARDPAARGELRRAAAARRLAELRDGVWVRPANLEPRRQPDALTVLTAQSTIGVAVFSDAAALASSLWDLEDWAAEAAAVTHRLERSAERLRTDAGALRAAFAQEAEALRHTQHDPLLPAALLPGRWPADALRAALAMHHDAFDRAWREWLRGGRGGRD